MTRTDLLQLYVCLGLTPIPLKPRSKEPLVKWRDGWNPTLKELEAWASRPSINWGVRCGEHLAALDFDSEAAYHDFAREHPPPPGCPVIKTGRGYHIWMKPKKPVRSQRVGGIEIKCLGNYVVAPPSIHPNSTPYSFEVAPNGALPEVNLEELLRLGRIDSLLPATSYEFIQRAVPSDFALRYGKSPYPRSLCGMATKVLSRSDGKVKHLVSMRDWKWDCQKCAPLLKRYWLAKLGSFSFRFILRAPTVAKPTTFLRRLGKPDYAHIVANGESWLFLTDADAEKVWAEARCVGYEPIAGDIAGDPTREEISECLDKALCQEEEPLNTRRKITHSRGLLKRASQEDLPNESKQQPDCGEGEDDKKATFGKGPLTWESEVMMKPIEEVAKELEAAGWRILWQSEVEALAIKGGSMDTAGADIVEIIGNLGVKLKKVGKEYMGLCPFHDDHKDSLSVNKEKRVWHCFGCGKGGNIHRFIEEWQAVRH